MIPIRFQVSKRWRLWFDTGIEAIEKWDREGDEQDGMGQVIFMPRGTPANDENIELFRLPLDGRLRWGWQW